MLTQTSLHFSTLNRKRARRVARAPAPSVKDGNLFKQAGGLGIWTSGCTRWVNVYGLGEQPATCQYDPPPGCMRPVQWVQRPILPVRHFFCCNTPARFALILQHSWADPERIDVSTSSALKAPEVPAPAPAPAPASASAAHAPASAPSVSKVPLAKAAGHLLSQGTFKGKYTLGATIGKGSFGEVHKATRKTDGKMCVGVEGSDPQTGTGCSTRPASSACTALRSRSCPRLPLQRPRTTTTCSMRCAVFPVPGW